MIVHNPILISKYFGYRQFEMVLNEYEDLFHIESSEETKKAVADLNTFVALVLPDINAGRTPDIEASAKKAGVDIETARDVVKMLMGKTKP